MRVLMALVLATAALSACTPESSSPPADVVATGSAEKCVRSLYSQYNPKDKKQCVAACIACERGVMTTCSTACTLRGAS